MSIGVPIQVLHEAEGHIVTCETKIGEVYRGKLIEAEDNMNCQLSDVEITYKNGDVRKTDNVFIRGSQIRFIIMPDMLQGSPMFKTNRPHRGSDRGKSGILRAQAARGLGPGQYSSNRGGWYGSGAGSSGTWRGDGRGNRGRGSRGRGSRGHDRSRSPSRSSYKKH